MKRWFDKLVNEFKIFNEENITIEKYFIFSSICYSITEYIFKDLGRKTKEKEELLNEKYNLSMNFIYNKKYLHNDLKHMIEGNWDSILETNYEDLFYDLKSSTNELINKYKIRNTLEADIRMIYLEELSKRIANSIEQIYQNSNIISQVINQTPNIYEPYIKLVNQSVNTIQPIIAQVNQMSTIYEPYIKEANKIIKTMTPLIDQVNEISRNLGNQ